MNSSQVWKRTLPILFIILIIIGIAVIIPALKKDKLVPSISDPDGIYLTINEGQRTYNIKRGYVYNELKPSVGLNTLLDMVDIKLLKTVKNSEGKNYYENVSEERIEEEIEKAIFPDGRKNLTEDEIQEAIDDFYTKMFLSSSLRTKEAVKDYYRLILAKKDYASDKLKEAIRNADEAAEKDSSLDKYFTDKEIETYYEENYLSGYWTIIVPFKTKVEAENALKAFGVKVHTKDGTTDYDRWIKIVDDEEVTLTPTEIAKIFIDMYNAAYSYKKYPSDVATLPTTSLETLIEDTHYSITDDGRIIFNTTISEENEDLNELYYTNEEITAYQKEIQNYLKVSMVSYDSEADLPKTKSWYTVNPRAYNNSSLYVYILKIKEEEAPKLEDVKDEILAALEEKELTDSYIAREIIKLRDQYDFALLDADFEKTYINNIKAYDEVYKKTKDQSETVIAKIRGAEFTADDLFKAMDARYGLAITASEINYQRFLNNPELNKVFDYYTPNLKDSERILNKEKWEEVREAAISEKNYFLSGGYAYYGYAASYGWKNFLKDYYGVSDTTGLLYTLLYSKLRNEYANSLGDVTEATETSELWKKIYEQMEKLENEYFSVSGIQLLISIKDEDGNYVPQEKWTALQNAYAKELYNSIWAYLETETSSYSDSLDKLVKLYNEAPRFLANKDQAVPTGNGANEQPIHEDLKYVVEDAGNYRIEVSKFKTAGLVIEFNNIGSFTNLTTEDTNSNVNDEIKRVAKEIWDASDKPSSSAVPYGYTFGGEVTDYLVSDKGYHLYINTSVSEIPTWNYDKSEEKFVLPTLQMVKTYLKDSSAAYLIDEDGEDTDIAFTASMKSAVTTYFTVIKDELTGSTNVLVKLYKAMADTEAISYDFKGTNYTKEDFINYLNKVITEYQEDLKYFTEE